MLEQLTEQQREMLLYVEDYIDRHGYSPTIRELVGSAGLKSLAPVQACLYHLQKKGYIDWDSGRARTIRVLRSTRSQSVSRRAEIAESVLRYLQNSPEIVAKSVQLQELLFGLEKNGAESL